MSSPSEVKTSNGTPSDAKKPYSYQAASSPAQNLFAEAQKHHQANRYKDAETLYKRIIETEPKHIGAWFLLGKACIGQKKVPEAVDAFQKAISLSPDHADAIAQLGMAQAQQHRLPEAMANLRRAIELSPEHAVAHRNLGVVLTQLGRHDEGLACYREATRVQPDYAEAHFNVGLALGDRKQHHEAIAAYEQAVKCRPDYVEAMYNLSVLLTHERRPAEAVVLMEHAIRLKPGYPEAHNNLAIALADVGRFAEAVTSCDEALSFRPLDPKLHANRANALTALGRIDEALASYDLAIRLQPDYASAHWNRSLALLLQGDFARGLLEYEWRWKRTETKTRNFPEPSWDGSSLEGKTILLWSEQGLGDTLQFVRYASLLRKRGATVWLECQPKLVPLLSLCPDIDRLFPEGPPLPAGFDCQAPLMSLPLLCGTTPGTIPSEVPYLRADAAHVERWRKELSTSSKFKIGIGWQGNPGHRFDHHRSFPVHWFRTIAMLDGVELYSLQKDPGTEQLAGIRFPVVELGSRLDQNGAFTETAAVMQSLDLVITCDSALAHLAGALGIPVWVAMSQVVDWRWLLDREDSLWYPTMRLFRQRKLGDWAPVFERMRQEVQVLRDAAAPTVRLEVAPGELLDKLTILQIKAERISDPEKLRNLRAELAVVEATRDKAIRPLPGLAELMRQLKEVNERLWDIENRIRACEKAEDFGSAFIGLARAVYQTNDRRAAIKHQLNELLGAKFREEKDYRVS